MGKKVWLWLLVLVVVTVVLPTAVFANGLMECSFDDLFMTGGVAIGFDQISGHAFQNAEGVSVVSQVSGDNNVITLPITINILLVDGDFYGDIIIDADREFYFHF